MSVTLRPAVAADLPTIHALQQRIEGADRLPVAKALGEFEDWLREPHLDVARDTRVAETGGAIVAWGRVWHRPSTEREERCWLFGGVSPEHRGRGIGRALLGWQLERAREKLRDAPAGLARFVRVSAFDHERARIRLCERLGLRAVRWGHDMLRGLESIPEAPLDAGLRLAAYRDEWFEATRAAMNEAFADHWGSAPRDAAGWAHDLAAHGVRPDLSFVALDGERVVGMTRNAHYPADEALTGRLDGWIQQLGVVRSHRKRGLASALVTASLAAFRDAGLTHAMLNVDSANPSGANRLYERLGFRVSHRSVTLQVEVPARA